MRRNRSWIAMMSLLVLLAGLLSPMGVSSPLAADTASVALAKSKAASGEATKVTYTYTYDKNVAYSKIKSKLQKKKTRFLQFEDSGSSSALTYYGFFYKSWPIAGYGYGVDQQSDVIILYPTIKAVPQGSSSKLSIGIKFRCNTQVISLTTRKFTRMTIAGGGQKVTISGKTSSRNKPMGQFVRNRIITTGFFTMSRNTAVHESRLKKIIQILGANKVTITFKESTHKKNYKCAISLDSAGAMLSLLDSYQSLLKNYRRKVKR